MVNNSGLMGIEIEEDVKKIRKTNENRCEDTNDTPPKTIRDTFYGRIDVSVKTMDKVIAVLMTLLVISIIIATVI